MPECIVKPWITNKYDEHWVKPCISNEAAHTLKDDARKELFELVIATGQLDPNDGFQSTRFIYQGRRVEVKKTNYNYDLYLSKDSTPSLNAKFLAFNENFGPLNGSTEDLQLRFSLEGKIVEANTKKKYLKGPSQELMGYVRDLEKVLKARVR